MNEAPAESIQTRVRARSLLVIVVAGCGGAPPMAPTVQVEAIGEPYYCGPTEDVSLTRMPPEGFVRIDLERTPARDACLAAQRRLDDAVGHDAQPRADEALVRACAARRCIFWRQATAVAARDVVKVLCVSERLSRADAVVADAIDARAHLDGGEPTDVDRALAALRRDATSAAGLRAEATSCIGAERVSSLASSAKR